MKISTPWRSELEGRSLSSLSPPQKPQRRISANEQTITQINAYAGLLPEKDGHDEDHYGKEKDEEEELELTEHTERTWLDDSSHSSDYLPPLAPQRRESHDKILMVQEGSSNKSKKVDGRRVFFSTVQIRHYERILDIHPCTSSGPSLGIGWSYCKQEEQYSVDEHEYQDHSSYNRYSYDLVVPKEERIALVKEWGFTDDDIAKAVRKQLRTKNQRKQTITTIQTLEQIESLAKNSKRRVQRLVRFSTAAA